MVPSDDAGWELLHELGLAPTQTTTEVRGMSLAQASFWRQLGALLLGGAGAMAVTMAIFALLGFQGAQVAAFTSETTPTGSLHSSHTRRTILMKSLAFAFHATRIARESSAS